MPTFNGSGPGLLAAAVLVACSDPAPGPTPPSDGFDRPGLLANLADHVVAPRLDRFVERSRALSMATAAHAEALSRTASSAATLAAAQTAWVDTMAAMQGLEPMQIGPAGDVGVLTGGQGLRDRWYSWPTTRPCGVDTTVVNENYAAPTFLDDALVDLVGLDAMETLLFSGPDNACAAPAEINMRGTWAALGDAEVARRRAAYAARLATGIQQAAERARAAWGAPDGGGFRDTLARAGGSGSDFRTAQAAVDEVFGGMFYLDRQVKDQKLGAPIGLSLPCTRPSCPELFEHARARRSKAALLANLTTFRAVFTGGEPGEARPGFDDFLVTLGAPELAERMVTKIDDAIAAVEAVPGELEDAVTADPSALRAAHAAVKTLTDDLKSQLVSVLNLRVPDEGAADND
jgi:predicted lipoprotein